MIMAEHEETHILMQMVNLVRVGLLIYLATFVIQLLLAGMTVRLKNPTDVMVLYHTPVNLAERVLKRLVDPGKHFVLPWLLVFAIALSLCVVLTKLVMPQP